MDADRLTAPDRPAPGSGPATSPGGGDPALLEALLKRGIVTTHPDDRDCCGLPRDEDGFCVVRERHPIYIDLTKLDERA